MGTFFIQVYICLLSAIRTTQYALAHTDENIRSTDAWKQGLIQLTREYKVVISHSTLILIVKHTPSFKFKWTKKKMTV